MNETHPLRLERCEAAAADAAASGGAKESGESEPSEPTDALNEAIASLAIEGEAAAGGAEGGQDMCDSGLEEADCVAAGCQLVHGLLCDMCARKSLHPTDETLRETHTTSCRRIRKQEERREEAALGRARSLEKSCGICLDMVMEKQPGEQRFGILPNCQHCFCLSCLRQWRQARQFEANIIRSCPQCRVPSDFVCPSVYWVDTKEQKEKLISDYKTALGLKDCKYFSSGRGKCPFGNKCFYRHAFPDGTKADVGPPRLRSRAPRQNLAMAMDLELDVEVDLLEENRLRLQALYEMSVVNQEIWDREMATMEVVAAPPGSLQPWVVRLFDLREPSLAQLTLMQLEYAEFVEYMESMGYLFETDSD